MCLVSSVFACTPSSSWGWGWGLTRTPALWCSARYASPTSRVVTCLTVIPVLCQFAQGDPSYCWQPGLSPHLSPPTKGPAPAGSPFPCCRDTSPSQSGSRLPGAGPPTRKLVQGIICSRWDKSETYGQRTEPSDQHSDVSRCGGAPGP